MEKITAQFIGVKKSVTEWQKKEIAIWEMENGRRISCPYGRIMKTLKPQRKQWFELSEIENWVNDMFFFPKKITNLSTGEGFRYDFKKNQLLSYNDNRYVSHVRKHTEYSIISQTNEISAIYEGTMHVQNSKYHVLKRNEQKTHLYDFIMKFPDNVKYVNVNYQNKGILLLELDYDDFLTFKFRNSLYLHKTEFGPMNNKYKIAIGKFPMFISNHTKQMTVIYDENKNQYVRLKDYRQQPL